MQIESLPRGRILTLALIFEGGMGVLALVLGWLLSVPILPEVRWSAAAAGWGVLATVPLVAGLIVLRAWRPRPLRPFLRLVEETVAPMFANSTALDLALISIAAGVGEEFLFRGLIQFGLTPYVGLTAALVLASVLFGLVHYISHTYAVLAGLIGVYLGWLYVATDSLTAPIVTHALYDFIALLIMQRGAVEPSTLAESDTIPSE